MELMESVAKADIFFIVTTIAVVLVTILVLAILIYIYRIVRDVRSVSEKIAKGGDMIASDILAVRESVKRGIARVLASIRKRGAGNTAKKRATKKKPLSVNP